MHQTVKLSLALACAAGCSTTDSSSLLTSGMHATITVRADGDGRSSVGATLRVGGASSLNFVDLVADDQLVASTVGVSRVMEQHELLGVISYDTLFDEDDAGTAFTVSLVRTLDVGAPASTVTLPEPIALRAPTAGATASRADELSLQWDPSADNDPIRWELQGACIAGEGGEIGDDTGEDVILAGGLMPAQGGDPNASCDVTLTIRRTRLGVLDPAYGEGGTISAEQVRRVTFSSTP